MGNFFFLEHAGELRIFVLREEKEWSNYKSQHHTLDQSEGCSGLKYRNNVTEKKHSVGPDHKAPQLTKPERAPCFPRQQALLLH